MVGTVDRILKPLNLSILPNAELPVEAVRVIANYEAIVAGRIPIFMGNRIFAADPRAHLRVPARLYELWRNKPLKEVAYIKVS